MAPRFGNYKFVMNVGSGSGYFGYDDGVITTNVFGKLDRIAGNAGLGLPSLLYADANGDLRMSLPTFNEHGVDDIVVTISGYDVNKEGGTPTSYGHPVRLGWDDVNDVFSTAVLGGSRTDLTDYLESLVGEDVYITYTQYTARG